MMIMLIIIIITIINANNWNCKKMKKTKRICDSNPCEGHLTPPIRDLKPYSSVTQAWYPKSLKVTNVIVTLTAIAIIVIIVWLSALSGLETLNGYHSPQEKSILLQYFQSTTTGDPGLGFPDCLYGGFLMSRACCVFLVSLSEGQLWGQKALLSTKGLHRSVSFAHPRQLQGQSHTYFQSEVAFFLVRCVNTSIKYKYSKHKHQVQVFLQKQFPKESFFQGTYHIHKIISKYLAIHGNLEFPCLSKPGSTPTPCARGLRDQIQKWALQTQKTLYF